LSVLNDNSLQESQRINGRERELKDYILDLENQLAQLRKEKEQLRLDFHSEIERQSRTHQEAIKILREESQDVEKKYFDELALKRRETETSTHREAQYMMTIQELREEILQLKERQKSSTHRRMSSEKKQKSRYGKMHGASPSRVYNSDTEESEPVKRSRDLESTSKMLDFDLGPNNLQFIKLRNRIETLESQLSVYERKVSDLEKERVHLITENERVVLIAESQKSKFS
jgi:hypothetical protein